MLGKPPSALIERDKAEALEAQRMATTLRWREGAFRVPGDASATVFKSELRKATVRFFAHMEKRKLTLASKDMKVLGPYDARSIEDLVIPGWNEFRIRALFRYTGPALVTKIIEIPSIMFRHNWGEEPNLDDARTVAELYAAL